ncbi:MAG: Ig-like domain-containing protein [Bacteroidales bacterium]|jgi:uncharacterized protein YjdB|nr:Ig-like domain-containing protein [Bacteroidales bacterium]
MYHQSFLSKTVAAGALAIALFLAGCDKKDEDVKVALKSIIVTPATNPVSLAKGDTYQLTAKPDPADAADVNIQWTSSAPDIATVSDAGLILAVEVGSAIVTASSGSIKSTVIVDVSPKALISFEVSPTRIDNLIVGEDLLLAVTKTPADAGGSFTFVSGNTNVATVSDEGLVRAVGAGSTEITVTPAGSNVAAKTVPVTVALPALISFTVTPLNLKEFGVPAQLEIVKTPDIAGGSFTYESNDAEVVTVSEAGLVTIVGKGSTTITVTSDNINVTPVQAPVTVGDALVNAKRPFQGENVIIPALGERMQQLVGWTHNPSWLVSYTTDNSTSMIIFSAPAWSLSHADNGKVYQTVTLQSGSYTLAFVGVGSPNNSSVEAYGVITTAETLPDLAEVTTDSRVLGYSELSAASGRHEIPFTLSGASSVTIGWVYSTFDNADIWSNMYMDGMELTKE